MSAAHTESVAVVGLGYVGTVTAACLARNGLSVTGVDIDEGKVASVNAGRALFSEPELDDLLAAVLRDGRMKARTEVHDAFLASRTWIITVGTPSGLDGDADLRAVQRVASTANRTLGELTAPPLVVLTSTVPPGTSEQIVLPTLEQGGLEEGRHFHFAYVPEFLREGSAVADFLDPQRTLLGTRTAASRDAAEAFFSRLNDAIRHCSVRTAEFAKYTDNTWHALKVAFANEIARIGDAMGVDPREAMELFAQDRRLNISSAYLAPGFAFGGSCLPKDVRTLSTRARAASVDAPVINSILASNEAHVFTAVRLIEGLDPERVGVVGLAFKEGTDDLRESPVLPLVRLLATGSREVVVHDPLIDPERLHGANALQLRTQLPEHERLLTPDVESVLAADVVVFTQRGELARTLAARLGPEQVLVDLAGVLTAADTAARYVGLAWP